MGILVVHCKSYMKSGQGGHGGIDTLSTHNSGCGRDLPHSITGHVAGCYWPYIHCMSQAYLLVHRHTWLVGHHAIIYSTGKYCWLKMALQIAMSQPPPPVIWYIPQRFLGCHRPGSVGWCLLNPSCRSLRLSWTPCRVYCLLVNISILLPLNTPSG